MKQAADSGMLSPAEIRKMDADGDGILSPQELEQGAAAAETAAAAAAPKEKMKKILRAKFKSPKEALQAMDKDGDGKISTEEMKMAMDADGDGKLSPAEQREAAKMMKELDK